MKRIGCVVVVAVPVVVDIHAVGRVAGIRRSSPPVGTGDTAVNPFKPPTSFSL